VPRGNGGSGGLGGLAFAKSCCGRSLSHHQIIVGDADAHHARAKAVGAEIVMPLSDKEHGGRDYTARDPEGYLWTFGTYDSWAEHPSA